MMNQIISFLTIFAFLLEPIPLYLAFGLVALAAVVVIVLVRDKLNTLEQKIEKEAQAAVATALGGDRGRLLRRLSNMQDFNTDVGLFQRFSTVETAVARLPHTFQEMNARIAESVRTRDLDFARLTARVTDGHATVSKLRAEFNEFRSVIFDGATEIASQFSEIYDDVDVGVDSLGVATSDTPKPVSLADRIQNAISWLRGFRAEFLDLQLIISYVYREIEKDCGEKSDDVQSEHGDSDAEVPDEPDMGSNDRLRLALIYLDRLRADFEHRRNTEIHKSSDNRGSDDDGGDEDSGSAGYEPKMGPR